MKLACWTLNGLRCGYSLALLRGDLVPPGIDRQALRVLVAGV